MQSEDIQHINLAQAAEASSHCDFQLGKDFFARLEQDEIVGGDIHVALSVKASAGNIYILHIQAEGNVVVPCDRCLDDLTIPVQAGDDIKIKDDAPEESDAAEMRYIENGNCTYDASWDVYEIIETQLPLQRVHNLEDCNPDMVSRLFQADDEEL